MQQKDTSCRCICGVIRAQRKVFPSDCKMGDTHTHAGKVLYIFRCVCDILQFQVIEMHPDVFFMMVYRDQTVNVAVCGLLNFSQVSL